ncbi:MAG: extracellular solute-binding protein, partial [Clostridia bacterium]|nr:extracellular solute-binding protein [Clostridia bacterium]
RFLMKRKAKRLLAFLVCMIMVIGAIAMPVSAATTNNSSSGNKVSISDVSEILNALSYKEYQDKYADYEDKADGMSNVVIDIVDNVDSNTAKIEKVDGYYGKDDVLKIADSGKVTWKFTVPQSGLYLIDIPYCQIVGKTTSIERVLSINGEIPFAEARSVILSKVWKYDYEYKTDENGNKVPSFKQDGNGNDIRPSVSEDPKWVTYTLQDADGHYTEPFEFFLKAGENTITLESTREPVVLGDIVLRPSASVNIPTYEEYLNKHGDIASNTPTSAGAIVIEAENVKNTSSVTIYPLQDRTSPITSGLTGAQSAKVQKYNIAGGTQWSSIGEWITYEVKVSESGYYGIAFRYKQDLLSGMYVSRKVYIDDELPFVEAANCRFDYSTDWNTKYIGDKVNEQERDFFFYLEAREEPYTIKFEVSLADMAVQIRQISDTLANLNAAYLEIIKLTGSDPDPNQSYKFSEVMPDVLETMMVESINLKKVFKALSETNKLKGENTATLEQLYILLNKMASDEREIAGNLETFKTQLGSLGTWITNVSSQPLKVDYLQIQPANAELPKSEGNFFKRLWYELSMFFYSFITDYNSLGAEAGDDDSEKEPVEVWIALGRDQAQVMRSLIDNDFTPKTGVSANLKLVSAGTLLPSVLAGKGPDVSLFESSAQIIDFALRSAVLPLNKFIEKDPEVLTWFPEVAMVPLTLHDNSEDAEVEYTYYGLPDKLSFSMLFYRKDILADLELDIPETWDDVLAMVPVLQYNNMEIGIQNDIYTFIYQSNNEAYKNGGMQINFDNTGVLGAFTRLCNMYTQYSLPTVYDFANRFRTGEMPIGIADYSTCNQLTLFASELSGLWGFTTLPGYEHERADGTKYINNSAIATVTGCVMLSGCEDEDDAWEFMKWYVGKDCQVAYTNEMVSIQGIAGRHPTPNTEAIKEIPWTNEERDAILSQFNNLAAVPNYPGSYYLARYVNFAFLAAYNEAKDPADSLLSYVPAINKEITRRRIEFDMDYIDVITGEKIIVSKK